MPSPTLDMPLETPTATSAEIKARLAELKQRIGSAASAAGRSGDAICILAVTKNHSPGLVRTAYDAGLRQFGENYVQEALGKQDALRDLVGANWQFIGRLQSNKTNVVDGHFSLIQSVDNLKLAQRIGRAATVRGAVQDVLVQIKLGDEAMKSGVAPDQLPALCDEAGMIEGVRVLGLMAIAPLAEDGYLVKEPRPFFALARQMFDSLPIEQRRVLSMGMSGDFEVAIAEGSNMIRVGTTLFGARH